MMMAIGMHGRQAAVWVAGMLAAVLTAQAQLVWTGNVNNAWNLTSANWRDGGGASATYSDGASVVFAASTQAMVNIALTVAPGSVLVSNSNARILTFTNNVISGATAIVKDNNGTVRFGNSAGTSAYAGSFPFTGGTTVRGGTLCYFVTNGSDLAKTTGGVPFGFGTGAITLANPSAVFNFSGWKGSNQLTNNVEVTGGGMLDLGRFDPQGSPQNNFSGNIALRTTNALVIKPAYTAYVDPKIGRIFSGTTTLYTNSTLLLYNQQYTPRALAYEQNITPANPAYALTCGRVKWHLLA